MTIAHHTRITDGEQSIETRLRECLTPRASSTERAGSFQSNFLHRELAIGLDGIGSRRAGDTACHLEVEAAREVIEAYLLERNPGGGKLLAAKQRAISAVKSLF